MARKGVGKRLNYSPIKSASTNTIKLVVVCLTAGALTPGAGTAQVAHPGEQDPAGRVYTQIVARVGELGSNSAPIAGLIVYVVSEDGLRVTLRTNLGGTAATWLSRARYRFVTPDPFQLDGRLYTWDTVTAIRPGMGLLRLYVANAKSQPVPIAAWRPGDAGSGETIKDRQTSRSLEREGVAVSATITRDRDLLWTDGLLERDDNATEVVLRIPTSGVTFEVPLSIR